TLDLDKFSDKNPSFTGAGILVVSGDIAFSSKTTFRWEGLVIITGERFDANNGGGYVEGGIAIVPKDKKAFMHVADGFTLKYNTDYIKSALAKVNKQIPIAVMTEY
ncbi:MAG: hypothetical protein AB1489_26995, partial [Acidobacteriota bacterium]